MKQLVIMNFLMLLFVTASQDTVKQALDLISADYEKKALKVVCKSIVERKDLVYADLRIMAKNVCVATSVSDYQYFLKKMGKLREEIKEGLEPGNELHTEIEEYCERGIQNDAIKRKGLRLLTDVFEHYECERLLEDE